MIDGMFVFGGLREYGRVERCGGTWVTTHFFHLNFLPLFPVRSIVRVDSGEQRDLPIQWRSVVAAYLRTYPFVTLAVGAFFPHLTLVTRAAVIAVALVLLAIGYFGIGRVSSTEAAKRRVLATHIGAPVDLAWVKGELPRVREVLHDEWNEIATRTGARGYRSGSDLEGAVDLDDDEALRVAFSLARVEATLAAGEARAPARALEDRLWSRIEELGV